jgi:hypothetical protein
LLSYKAAKIVTDFEFDIAIAIVIIFAIVIVIVIVIAIAIAIVFADDHHFLPNLLIEKALNFQLQVNR